MTQWTAVFKNSKGNELRIRIIDEGGKTFLQTENGARQPFNETISDAAHGLMKYVDSIEVKPTPPRPVDTKREEAIQILLAKLRAFATPGAYESFLNGEAELRHSIDRGFEGVSIDQLGAWTYLVGKAAAERLFTQEQRRQIFTGKMIGPHLYIGTELIPSSPSNDWNGTFAVECHECRTLKAATIHQVDILKMRAGLEPMYECRRPCVKS